MRVHPLRQGSEFNYRVEDVGDRPPRQAVTPSEQETQPVVDPRHDGQGEGADEEGNRVEEARRLDSEQRGAEKEQQNAELPPGARRLDPPLFRERSSEEADRVVERPEGTDPSAERPPEEEGDGQKQEGEEQGRRDRARREEGR